MSLETILSARARTHARAHARTHAHAHTHTEVRPCRKQQLLTQKPSMSWSRVNDTLMTGTDAVEVERAAADDRNTINPQKVMIEVQCCFTSTEITLRTIRDGEPRTATSTLTQLLGSLGDAGAETLCVFY